MNRLAILYKMFILKVGNKAILLLVETGTVRHKIGCLSHKDRPSIWTVVSTSPIQTIIEYNVFLLKLLSNVRFVLLTRFPLFSMNENADWFKWMSVLSCVGQEWSEISLYDCKYVRMDGNLTWKNHFQSRCRQPLLKDHFTDTYNLLRNIESQKKLRSVENIALKSLF